MSEMNQNEIVPVGTEEDYPLKYVDGRVYDEREERRKDKIVDSIHKVAETVKTEAAIAKKEADTSAHATKTHIDSENAYIASLLKEKERKGITPEATAVLNNRIEEAQIRLKSSEREARRQADESPYRGPIPWGKVFKWVLIIGLAGGAGYGGYKLIPKLAR